MDDLTRQMKAEQLWWLCPYIMIILSLLACAVFAIRTYVEGCCCPSRNRIDGKVVIITAGAGGIGLATAKELARRGATLILAVRNAPRGRRALESLRRSCPDVDVVIKLVDFTDFVSIREFVNQVSLEFEKVDVLINNAGTVFQPFKKTPDGNEVTITTNYFAPFLLTHLMLNLLNNSTNARVINLTAAEHLNAKIDLDDLNSEKNFNKIEVFAQSKLALTLFTKEMASLLKHSNITVNSVNPGLVRGTQHFRHCLLKKSFLGRLIMGPWIWLLMKTPRAASQTVIYAAVDPSLFNVSGVYLSDCCIQRPNQLVNDTTLLERLYKKTCEILQFNGEEYINKFIPYHANYSNVM